MKERKKKKRHHYSYSSLGWLTDFFADITWCDINKILKPKVRCEASLNTLEICPARRGRGIKAKGKVVGMSVNDY